MNKRRRWLLWLRRPLLWGWLGVAAPALVSGQSSFVPQGTEYSVTSLLPGDQVHPQASVNSSGGYLVWDDNATDGAGQGISALRLDSSLSAMFSSFRVNVTGTNDQERPQVSLLNGGGAVFVWQGGLRSYQHVYARYLSAANTWLTTNDVLVNTFTNNFQINPVVATLTNGAVVVAWGSYNQATTNSLQDVYVQQLSATGAKIGGEFLANQFTSFNQRTPVLAALSDGRFVVVWVSEQETGDNRVDIYARIFTSAGAAAGNEFLVNTSTNVCANPSVAGGANGGFVVAWGERDSVARTNGWDVFARAFNGAGVGGTVQPLNTFIFGDQYAPKVSALPTGYLAVWNSMGQDGSWEGVFGRFLDPTATPWGAEFRVSTTTVGGQVYPTAVSDGGGRFLAAWSSFTGSAKGMDLFAQRYAIAGLPLPAPNPPFVTGLSSNALSVSWPAVAGFSVANYEVYADGAFSATAVVTNDWWTMTGLAPSSTHSFQVDYVLTDSRRSPPSGPASGTTYGSLTWGGIPYEWMTLYFGGDVYSWPSPYADSDGDGVSNLNEFLAGTNPTDVSSVLRIRLQATQQGLYLNWNTQPGLIYQVQSSGNMTAWAGLGGARFAAGSVDSMFVGGSSKGYYRVVRLR